jgi:Xaa-Pro aminopeptidase
MYLDTRRAWARRQAKKHGVDALLITHLPDVFYLTGFTGSNAAIVLAGRNTVLFTDGRYTTQAAQEAVGVKVVIAAQAAAVAACTWMAGKAIPTCGFDGAHTTVAAFEAMRKVLPVKLRRKLVSVGSLVATLRETKDEVEIEQMRRAAALGCRLFDDIFDHIVPSATEADVALALETAARRGGATGMSFDTIVAGGVRSALPHGRATAAKLPRRGFLTMDFGVMLDGYASDMTRTVYIGRARKREREVYDSVLEAQQAAVDAIAPGVTGAMVDEAARSVLRRAGLDQYFIHSTGHGVGLEIHEGPRIAAKSNESLQPGMIVTVEPGVYLPGEFGVRIEDMVLVTPTGAEVLTPSTKALIEL